MHLSISPSPLSPPSVLSSSSPSCSVTAHPRHSLLPLSFVSLVSPFPSSASSCTSTSSPLPSKASQFTLPILKPSSPPSPTIFRRRQTSCSSSKRPLLSPHHFFSSFSSARRPLRVAQGGRGGDEDVCEGCVGAFVGSRRRSSRSATGFRPSGDGKECTGNCFRQTRYFLRKLGVRGSVRRLEASLSTRVKTVRGGRDGTV